jgi:hypothetical protein
MGGRRNGYAEKGTLAFTLPSAAGEVRLIYAECDDLV